MNPLSAAVLAGFAAFVPFAPWRRGAGERNRAARALLLEGGVLLVVLAGATLLARLATPTAAGARWGAVVLYAAGYWYAVAGGVGLVRLVLAVVPVTERAGGSGGEIAVPAGELERGRVIGILERAIAMTLVLAGQFGALGLIVAAKAVARFRGLEDRDFAEYFLIGTLASLLHALVVGMGVGLLL